MHKTAKKTPLLLLLREMSPAERETFATWAGTTASYLYQLAAGRSCRIGLALGIEKASARMHKRTGGRTPVVTMVQLAAMKKL
jgi:hypothetical protein